MSNFHIEFNSLLKEYEAYPFAFSLEDLLQNFPIDEVAEIRTEEFYKLLISSKIFLSINLNQKVFFISKRILYTHFININIRLSEIKKFKVNKNYIRIKFKDIFGYYNLDDIPVEIFDWAMSLGLIVHGDEVHYLFPLAKLLFYFPKEKYQILISVLYNLIYSDFYFKDLNCLADSFFDEASKHFAKREMEIIFNRKTIKNQRKSLSFLSKKYNLSRERIRQLELRITRNIIRNTSTTIYWFNFLILNIMHLKGRLIFKNNYNYNRLIFLFQILGLSYFNFKDFFILLHKNIDFENFLDNNLEIEILYNTSKVKDLWLKNNEIVLSFDDFKELLILMIKERFLKLKKKDRVYLTLKYIGKPLHYSEITEIHNQIFSNKICSEREIHSCLLEKYGIVWVGIKGTYALKEWGYKKPNNKIFNLVYRIVKKLYLERKRPISILEIINEVKNYRKVFNGRSVLCALSYNKYIKKVGRDLYICNKNVKNLKNNTSETINFKKISDGFEIFKEKFYKNKE